MQVAYALLARAAELSPDARLSVVGGDFDTVQTDKLPAQYTFALAAKFVFEAAELQTTHVYRVEISDPSGRRRPILLDAALELPPRPVHSDQGSGAAMVVDINLTIASAGPHWFHLVVDGAEVRRLPLNVDVVDTRPISEALASAQR